jgi:hypothetical protein
MHRLAAAALRLMIIRMEYKDPSDILRSFQRQSTAGHPLPVQGMELSHSASGLFTGKILNGRDKVGRFAL